MSWYAIGCVDEAIDATRRFLFPFSLVAWLKLALIAAFVGGGGGATNVMNAPGAAPADPIPPRADPGVPGVPPDLPPEFGRIDPALVVAVGVAVALLALALAVFSETLRLVFYDALRTGTVRLRGPFRRRFGQAVRLLAFKLGVGLLAAAPFAVAGFVLYATGVDPAQFGTAAVVAGILIGLLVGIAVVALSLAIRFTNEFVVPVMVLTDGGVVDSWRRFWPALREQWTQFFVYVLVHFFLLLAIGIGQSIVTLLVGGVVAALAALAALVVVFGAFGSFAAATASTAGIVVLGALAALAALAIVLLVLPIRIIVLTYVATYEVSVLGAADESLRLLPPADGVDAERSGTPPA